MGSGLQHLDQHYSKQIYSDYFGILQQEKPDPTCCPYQQVISAVCDSSLLKQDSAMTAMRTIFVSAMLVLALAAAAVPATTAASIITPTGSERAAITSGTNRRLLLANILAEYAAVSPFHARSLSTINPEKPNKPKDAKTSSEKRYFDVLTRFTAAKKAESKP